LGVKFSLADSTSQQCARRSAGSILFSLVQTCKEHHGDVFAYFKYALDHVMHCQTTQDFENLLPFNCHKTQLDKQRDIPLLQFPDISDK
jgi:transposase